MPIIDITIDTNVLMHSNNPKEIRCTDAISFLRNLINGTTKLVVDSDGLIIAEYTAKLVPGSLASSVIAALARSQRVISAPTAVAAHTNRKLSRMVANKRDRTFVKVCANSGGKSFVSHDFLDFSLKKRNDLGTIFSIKIVEAGAATTLL